MANIHREIVMLADEVEMYMDIEYLDGEAADTEITIDGSFCVSGQEREEFSRNLQELVDRYKI